MSAKLNPLELEALFHREISPLKSALESFPWQEKQAYCLWLAQTYHFVKHTIRYLCLSAGKSGLNQDELHHHALKHIREEIGHEQLILQDLKHLGVSIKDLPAFAEIEALTQSQYYWLDRNLFAFLGYSLCLEGLAAGSGRNLLDQVLLKHYPPKACNFIRVHAVVDEDHFADGMQHLRQLDLTPEDQQAILSNLRQTVALYGCMLLKITNFDPQMIGILQPQKQNRAA